MEPLHVTTQPWTLPRSTLQPLRHDGAETQVAGVVDLGELSPHVLKRMVDRRFTELDLGAMLESASSYRKDVVPARWVIETKHDRKRWEVIVEPDESLELLVVVTAYPAED
jgi:hypothetical protein